MMPPDHTEYRRVIGSVLSASVVDACRPEVGGLAGHAVSALADASRRAERRGVDPRPHLQRYATEAFLRLFFGLRRGSPALARAASLYAEGAPLGERPRGGVGAIEHAMLEMESVLTAAGRNADDARRRGADAPPSFAARLAETYPAYLDDENVTRNLVAICGTGSRDVAALLHWIVAMLGDAPEWQERARADSSDEVATWITMETLRLEQSEWVMRRVLEPVQVGGYSIPAGWLLRICVRESHRDGTVFDRPETFDPGRFAGSRFRRTEYAPFGMRRHSCLGVSTAMTTACELIRALTRHSRLVVTRDGPPEYDYIHWRPTTRHRVRLEPLPDTAA
jgi:cytochrome P450